MQSAFLSSLNFKIMYHNKQSSAGFLKNNAGGITGFILGVIGFLILFKVIILDNHPPSDELAPGIVVVLSVIAGLVMAVAGNFIQRRSGKNKS